jgi:hypothetical protein
MRARVMAGHFLFEPEFCAPAHWLGEVPVLAIRRALNNNYCCSKGDIRPNLTLSHIIISLLLCNDIW